MLTASTIDMQKIDMGIALCHFDLMMKELGIEAEFVLKDPSVESALGLEYIGSFQIV